MPTNEDVEPTTASPPDELLELIGGRAALNDIVRRFYESVLADPDLAPIFATADIDHLVSMQQELLAAAFSGMTTDARVDLGAVHAGRGITPRHFSRFMEHLLDTLAERGVSQPVLVRAADRLGLFADEVLGQSNQSD